MNNHDWELFFGEQVKQFRQANGWTQGELARRMTVVGYTMHQTTVAKVENATRPTNVGEVAALAAIFAVPVSALFGESDTKPLEMANLNATMTAVADELETMAKRLRG